MMIDTPNLLTMFRDTVLRRDKAVCFRYKSKGGWQSLDWNLVYQKVLDLTGGLSKLGVGRGDRVCLFSKTRYEWSVADMAILACGAVSVPIYESSLPDQAAYIINNCGAKVIFVENKVQYQKIKSVQNQCSSLKQIICFDDISDKPEGVYSLDDVNLLGSGEGAQIFESMSQELSLNDHASYVYTSGTTGPPKGVMLTHRNFLAEIRSLRQTLDFNEKTESLLFLPLAHIFARVVQFAHFDNGFVQCYAESIDRLLDNISEVKPHLLASVPRIFEKVHTRVMQGVESGSEAKKKIFNWALNVGQKRARCIINGQSVDLVTRAQWVLAYKLVFSKLHDKMGGRVNYFISGGAPLAKEIADFFYAAGFYILEGYGLTETSAAITCNSKKAVKLGTVGKAVDGVEIKIAEDGEILARGDVIFEGYYKNEKATQEALTEDGWFHTGDIGEIDNQGFLKITDRKKDIIVTAAGKNVAPQNIENLIKTDPLISQVMIHGDKRKFLSALVTLNQEEVEAFASLNNIQFADYKALVKDQKIYHLIKKRIEEKNKQLSRYETVKKFAILESDFSVETGELTPTLKVKRKFTSEKYRNILDNFYQD